MRLIVGELDMSAGETSASRAFANPKSRILAASWFASLMFAGFRSRWMIPRS
jgi:hypothetical protein